MNRRVIFRADGNAQIGYGHFIRTLGIAGLVNKEFYCVYATVEPTAYQLSEIKKVCNEIMVLPQAESHLEVFYDNLKGDEIVVMDDYRFTSDYQLRIRNKGCKVIYIDDLNEKFFVCDVLINNIPGFDEGSFKKAEYTKLCLGTDYALLRKEFFDPKWRDAEKMDKKVFLAFGGSDMHNISLKLIRYFSEVDTELSLHVLTGDAYKYNDQLKQYSNVTIHRNILAAEVAELISTSMVCIIPASSLLNEAACIGSRILLGFFADNQIQPYRFFVDNKLAVGVGDFRTLEKGYFREKFQEARETDMIIDNQRRHYRYQQEKNIMEIFYKVSN